MKNRGLLWISTVCFFSFSLVAGWGQVSAVMAKPDAKEMYAGKKIKMIVPYGPGGGYDTTARTLAPFIGKYTAARVILRNVTGGGGLNGMNVLWKSKPDGFTIGLITGIPASFNQIAGSKGVKFDLRKFAWLARVSPTPNVLAVGAGGSFKTLEDISKADRPLKSGTTGRGSSITVLGKLMGMTLGFNVKFVFAYSSTSEVFVSMVRGDTDFIATVYDSVLR